MGEKILDLEKDLLEQIIIQGNFEIPVTNEANEKISFQIFV